MCQNGDTHTIQIRACLEKVHWHLCLRIKVTVLKMAQNILKTGYRTFTILPPLKRNIIITTGRGLRKSKTHLGYLKK